MYTAVSLTRASRGKTFGPWRCGLAQSTPTHAGLCHATKIHPRNIVRMNDWRYHWSQRLKKAPALHSKPAPLHCWTLETLNRCSRAQPNLGCSFRPRAYFWTRVTSITRPWTTTHRPQHVSTKTPRVLANPQSSDANDVLQCPALNASHRSPPTGDAACRCSGCPLTWDDCAAEPVRSRPGPCAFPSRHPAGGG